MITSSEIYDPLCRDGLDRTYKLWKKEVCVNSCGIQINILQLFLFKDREKKFED